MLKYQTKEKPLKLFKGLVIKIKSESMKTILFLTLFFNLLLFGATRATTLLDVQENNATIKADSNVQIGMSGFVVHQLAPERSIITKSIEVVAINKITGEATVVFKPFHLFVNNNLPSGSYEAQVGDRVVLAFGYNRGFIVAPSETIFYTLKKAMQGEIVVHPDIFTTFLSHQGHPSPLKDDFTSFCDNISLGLIFFYIEQKLYTVDSHSFKILSTQDAPLAQENTQKPFYSRITEIEANWFGAGSSEMENYSRYYFQLLLRYNPKNEKLAEAIRRYEQSGTDTL